MGSGIVSSSLSDLLLLLESLTVLVLRMEVVSEVSRLIVAPLSGSGEAAFTGRSSWEVTSEGR